MFTEYNIIKYKCIIDIKHTFIGLTIIEISKIRLIYSVSHNYIFIRILISN